MTDKILHSALYLFRLHERIRVSIDLRTTSSGCAYNIVMSADSTMARGVCQCIQRVSGALLSFSSKAMTRPCGPLREVPLRFHPSGLAQEASRIATGTHLKAMNRKESLGSTN